MRAERDLHQLKEFNKGIVHAVAEALLTQVVAGIVTFVNPAMEELVGISANELIGSHWRKLVPEGQVKLVLKRLAKRPAGVTDQYETRLLSKDGREIPILVSACPLFDDGTYTGVLSAFTDITERVRAEDALRESEETTRALLNASTDAAAVLLTLMGLSWL